MIPRLIHQTSRLLSPEEGRLSARMQLMLRGWEYRLWTDAQNQRLVDEQYPRYASAYRSIRRGVVKADIVRYMYLASFGGFYFDTDYKLIRGIDDDMLDHSCILPVSRESDPFRLGNAVMGSEPGHPFWINFIDHIFENAQLSELAERSIEKTTGPEGLTDYYLAHRGRYSDVYLPSREIFHPPLTQLGFSFRKCHATLGAHLCWGSWRTKGPLSMMRTLAVRKLTSI